MEENDELEEGYFIDAVEGENVHYPDLHDLQLEDEGEEEEESEEESEATVPVRDDAKLCVAAHKGSVFSVSFSPSGDLACSGGEDDLGVVWKLSTGETVFQSDGHTDSVTCTGFSREGKYVAIADMGGLVKVWAPSTGKLIWSFEVGQDAEWLKWHPQAQVLLLGDSSGAVWMWKIPSGETKTIQGSNARNTCGTLTADGKHVCCGYEDGAVKVVDLKSGSTVASLSGGVTADHGTAAEATTRTVGDGHGGSVTSIAAHGDGALLITGSEDGTSKLINSTNGKVLCVFPAGLATETRSSSDSGSREGMEGVEDEYSSDRRSVEAVCFCPVLPVVATGSLSGHVGVWDIATHRLRQKCMQESQYQSELAGVTRLCCCEGQPVVCSGGTDGVVRAWDLRSGQLEREWHGHSGSVLDLTLLQNEKLLSASDDGTVRLFSF